MPADIRIRFTETLETPSPEPEQVPSPSPETAEDEYALRVAENAAGENVPNPESGAPGMAESPDIRPPQTDTHMSPPKVGGRPTSRMALHSKSTNALRPKAAKRTDDEQPVAEEPERPAPPEEEAVEPALDAAGGSGDKQPPADLPTGSDDDGDRNGPEKDNGRPSESEPEQPPEVGSSDPEEIHEDNYFDARNRDRMHPVSRQRRIDSDKELLHGIAEGDQEAGDKLVGRYRSLVENAADRVIDEVMQTSDIDRAQLPPKEDVVQEGLRWFLEASKSWDSEQGMLAPYASFAAWGRMQGYVEKRVYTAETPTESSALGTVESSPQPELQGDPNLADERPMSGRLVNEAAPSDPYDDVEDALFVQQLGRHVLTDLLPEYASQIDEADDPREHKKRQEAAEYLRRFIGAPIEQPEAQANEPDAAEDSAPTPVGPQTMKTIASEVGSSYGTVQRRIQHCLSWLREALELEEPS